MCRVSRVQKGPDPLDVDDPGPFMFVVKNEPQAMIVTVILRVITVMVITGNYW